MITYSKWKISMNAQTFDFSTKSDAERKLKELIDAGIWWINLTTEEEKPAEKKK